MHGGQGNHGGGQSFITGRDANHRPARGQGTDQAAAKEITRNGGIPFAAFVSDPCDGRSQGTHGMFDSLPYRNDAAIVFRRLIRSLPTRRAVIGVATCDKGLPAT
ncbi:dihydroxy-acid dehydratase domain-containing protein, partial [Enterobacter bugandensis]|uniref:dihydroxy-acid dehydratase domain-containing protein n=1 Tax=Enterobacter bugandensis TaxID=881260 RepID=UPI003703CF93